MSYLIDTNVLSELVRPKPSPAVLVWFGNVPDDSLYISVLTIGEIRKGVESLTAAAHREKLRVWLEHTLPDWFQQRVLAIDEPVTERWGRLLAEVNRPVPAIDSLLAATALHHDLRMVTRNVQDVTFPDLEVINPWE
ncbi:MAG: type II toxin-antitoxin system VapC family toxin [Mariprofundaceae bacterium]|nr:type II toxin-antitoxin system VapC family toxin [Mariprofundaceae bacterium]